MAEVSYGKLFAASHLNLAYSVQYLIRCRSKFDPGIEIFRYLP